MTLETNQIAANETAAGGPTGAVCPNDTCRRSGSPIERIHEETMIDILNESVLPLRDAADLIPRLRRGKRVHFSTLWRWATGGSRGVKLETVRVGSTLCTSREAVARFVEALSRPPGAPVVRSVAARRRGNEAAARELDAAGL
jgi:uncharacterized protein DUF1580